jgi:hypothetical protein
VNLLPTAKSLRRGIHVDSLMIEASKLLIRGMAIEHLTLVEIIKLELGSGLWGKACVMLVGGRVDDKTTSGTCALVVVPAAAASHILDH